MRRYLGIKTVLLASLTMMVFGVMSPVTAKGKVEKLPVCHLTSNGDFKLLNLPLGGSLGHLLHHEADMVPVDGECIEEVTYEIGDAGPGGGIVFYVNEDGTSGLEVAPEIQRVAPWCEDNIDISGVYNISNSSEADAQTGAENTAAIVTECADPRLSAALVTTQYVWPNGQTDGFLPNKEELELLFDQSGVVTGFPNGGYWSSSEFSYVGAWAQLYPTGRQFIGAKYTAHLVRAVRAF